MVERSTRRRTYVVPFVHSVVDAFVCVTFDLAPPLPDVTLAVWCVVCSTPARFRGSVVFSGNQANSNGGGISIGNGGTTT